MTSRSIWMIPAALLFTLLAGCPAVELRDANEQLTSYYLAKQQSMEAGDWQMLETSVASLKALAKDAASRARSEDNRLNRIALYRIAATAAWQAEVTDVVAYGREGQELCDDDTFKQAPRDCGMLMVIPTLAGVDETTGRLDELQPAVNAAGDDVSDSMRAATEQIYDDYVAALDVLLASRVNILASDAHPLFKEQLDENIDKLFCNLLEGQVRGLAVVTESTRRDEIAEGLDERFCRIVRAGVPRATVDCVNLACN